MSSSSSKLQRSPWPQALSGFKRRLEAMPSSAPEDSIVLRVLAQLLVTIGIISNSVAAAGVTETSILNLLAVPLSALGATWSWHRRHQRNITTKFCIAIGMLIALAIFFVRLLGSPGDTRIVLAELLIYLQVLHSFDLPRRKDLGYSMVIGLILIGVAATISQTLAFGPLLLLFLAIALPVLVLDYRSRLGLLTQSWRLSQVNLSPRRWGLFLLVTLGLGLVIFAALPRFPGYQISTFPVSTAVEFEGDFDGRRVLNPGYVNEGQTGDEDGTEQGDGTGGAEGKDGLFDQNFYYGFNSQINQNLRGQLQPRVVMRVRSQAEGFWRVVAFDRYTGQGWEISRNDNATKLKRPDWSYQFFLPVLPKPVRSRHVIQTYTVVSDLPNLIPALYKPKQIYFPTKELAIDPEDSLRAPFGLSEGLTYSVVSLVPYRDRTLLQQATAEYPNYLGEYYLQLPPEISERVRQHTEALLARSPNPIEQPYEKALFLAQSLKQLYTIQPDLPFLSEEEDLVEAFLFKYEGGYPDHFSTVLTIMLRSIGIPSRLVAGFGPGQFNPFTGFHVVRNTDAYAMTEVFFPKYGWFAFDPIPGHELIPPSIEDYAPFSVLRQFWRWIAGWLPSPVTGFLNYIFDGAIKTLARIIAWAANLFTNRWVGALVSLGLLISLSFISWLGWLGWRAWRYQHWLSKLPPMEGLYQQMLGWLAEHGLRKSSAQTPLEYAERAYSHYETERAQIIDEISQAYVRWRYGGRTPNLVRLRQRLRILRQRQVPKRRRA
ncbi:MAG: DUF3488 domain-containing protein [Cyanothece sp. SIO1E1]|nr:DUF3488 domain-containing protein [Cyanothece sp. SIO1E1]